MAMEILPNPSNGEVQIIFSENLDHIEAEIRMLNLAGQEINAESSISGNKIEVNWNGPSGVYYIEIQINGTVYRALVIKN